MRTKRHYRPFYLSGADTDCAACSSAIRCWGEPPALREGIRARRELPLERGALLLQHGEPTSGVYMVADGCLLLRQSQAQGHQRVIGLRLPGELVGAQHYAHTLSSYTAQAATATLVCRLNLLAMGSGRSNPYLLERVLIKYTMQTERAAAARPGSPALERVAAFLENYAFRAQVGGVGDSQFRLPMTRAEIASYLGLAPETVVRALGKLTVAGRLTVRGRAIRLDNASPATATSTTILVDSC